MQNLSLHYVYDMKMSLICMKKHVYYSIGETHFHIHDFILRVILKQRQKATQKWPITLQQTLRTFTVQDLSQSSEEKQSCISSTNGCDSL